MTRVADLDFPCAQWTWLEKIIFIIWKEWKNNEYFTGWYSRGTWGSLKGGVGRHSVSILVLIIKSKKMNENSN